MMFRSSRHTHTEGSIEKAAFVRRLAEYLNPAEILYRDEDVRPFECDGLSAYRVQPWLVVLPKTIAQVQAVLRLCHTHDVPVVARGAGTGLSGGALPHENGVLLSLAKFNRILAIDPTNRTARVQPGVRNLAVSDAAAPYGLFYAPDPSSQIACTIGGNVAENSGGVHCLKYGLTVHNVLQVTLLTIEGEILELGCGGLDSPGYDLMALITGSEGLLGIIIEVTLKLIPLPAEVQTVMASFASVEDAGRAVAALIGGGLIPAGLEMMDNPAIRAAEAFVHAGYPVDAAAILLCELDGPAAQVKRDVSVTRTILLGNGAVEIREAVDVNERRRLWAGRKSAFPAVGRISPDYYCMDGTIPRHALAAILGRISELSRQYGLGVANVFHAGDGNLHPLILYDASIAGELKRAEEFGGAILEECIRAGGSITGEHGVGAEKLDQMCLQFNDNELGQFYAIKSAFDPKGLLNPGKAIPTLHRCAEFGAMHVHKGRLEHPDLERF